MRTRLGEITIGKIIVCLSIVSIATLMFTSVWSGSYAFENVLSLPIEDYLIGFIIYLVSIFIGFFLILLDFSRKLNIPGFAADTSADKEILKIKKNGYFIYCSGTGWSKPKKNEYIYFNTKDVTTFDRILYSYGPPLDEIWDFNHGLVFWFVMLPLMGSATVAVFIFLPIIILLLIYNSIF
tara:strand:+ start:186 stop:728 length:543 start_codon:yes stop_codon:yes gene_type:complete